METRVDTRVRKARLRESGNLCLQSDHGSCNTLLTHCINWHYLSFFWVKISLACEPVLTEMGRILGQLDWAWKDKKPPSSLSWMSVGTSWATSYIHSMREHAGLRTLSDRSGMGCATRAAGLQSNPLKTQRAIEMPVCVGVLKDRDKCDIWRV